MLPIVAFAMFCCGSAAAQSSTQPNVAGVQIGFQGKYKLGYWTPVRVTLSSGAGAVSGSLSLTVLDSDGLRTRFADPRTIELTAQSEVVVERYVKFGCLGGRLLVQLHGHDGSVVTSRSFLSSELPRPLPSSIKLFVSVVPSIDGRSMIDVDRAIQLHSRGQHADDDLWESSQLEDPSQLPEQWWGYEGVDSLFVTTGRVNTLEQFSPQQYAALELWVRLGGRLVVGVGSRGGEIFSALSRYQSLAPGTFEYVLGQDEGTRPLSETPGLMTLAGTKQPVGELKVAYFRDVPKQYVANDEPVGFGRLDRRVPNASVPTIMRKPLGFGRVVLVALDLEEPPMADWPGRARLLERILSDELDDRIETSEPQRTAQASQIGYDDLTGQLRAALDQYQQVTLVAFSWVAGLVVIYILLIGPGDYFFLKRFVGRMQWTWLTFTLVVIGFCLLPVFLSATWKGRRIHINQVDLVDIDLTGDGSTDHRGGAPAALVRGTTWTSLYSPRADLYDLSFLPQPPGEEVEPTALLFSWQGLPGEALGGMSRRSAPSLFSAAYAVAADPRRSPEASPALTGLPIAASSSRALVGRWWCKRKIGSAGRMIVRHLAGKIDDNPLEGEIVNPLDVELTDCVLFYGRSAYVLEHSLAPGQSFVLLGEEYPPSIKRRLKRVHADGALDRPTDWDATDDNVSRILEIMMFHDAAEGRAYTHLSHRYQKYVDLSDHLKMGRAILTGQAKQPAGRLLRDGRPQTENYDAHWTFYRLVIPVDRIEVESR